MTAAELLDEARRIAPRAHAPFSHIRVGAVVEGPDGALYRGVNVESVSYGLTLCAERAAVARAVAEGGQRIVRVAVARADGVPVVPCGACRQVLAEFGADLTVVHDGVGGPVERSLRELFPDPFALP